MNRYVDITIQTKPPVLTAPLGVLFGSGESGWLTRDVPPGTHFNVADGRCSGPTGTFVRSPATNLWARAG